MTSHIFSVRLRFLACAAAVAASSALFANPARAAIGEQYEPGAGVATSTWFALRSESAQRIDREYVTGMRPHHAGALTMSAEYLRDPGRSSPLLQALSRAIVANQTFEIGVLDEIARNLDAPPVRMFGLTLQPVATGGMAQAERFLKTPIPSRLTHAIGPVSETDVRFAKAMIIHHQGAVDMARDYLANSGARNGFLGWMNVYVQTDQMQEIALLRRIIAAYPGNPDLIEVPPSMVHGMEGMQHGPGGHGAHAAPTPASATQLGGNPHAGHHAHGLGAGAAADRAGDNTGTVRGGPHQGHH